MVSKQIFLGLDVGTKRVGVAVGDSAARIAHPLPTVSAQEPQTIHDFIREHQVTDIVVGRPRNQAGETTVQTELVEAFITAMFQTANLPIHWQDESVTSVMAEERLKSSKKPYTKADIDAEAATIILQDYLETL
jgi:putative Holliday junction resolvase